MSTLQKVPGAGADSTRMRSATLAVLAALAALALPGAAPASTPSQDGASASAKSGHGLSYRRVVPPKKHKSGRIAYRRVPPPKKHKPPPKKKGHH